MLLFFPNVGNELELLLDCEVTLVKRSQQRQLLTQINQQASQEEMINMLFPKGLKLKITLFSNKANLNFIEMKILNDIMGLKSGTKIRFQHQFINNSLNIKWL